MKHLLLLLLCLELPCGAANWFVRTNAVGNGGATAWTNACSVATIPWSSVAAGDTIWLAGGDYAGFAPSASGTTGNYVTLKRAIGIGACTNTPGWSASFNAQAVISAPMLISGIDWFAIDGSIANGIKITVPDSGPTYGIQANQAYASHIRLTYLEICGLNKTSADQWYYDCQGMSICDTLALGWTNKKPFWYWGHLNIHDVPTGAYITAADDLTIEYCELHDCGDSTYEPHPNMLWLGQLDRFTFRYNQCYGNITEGLYSDHPSIPISDWKIYRNVWYNELCFCIYITNPSTNVFIFNNTFYNPPGNFGQSSSASQVNFRVFNNCIWSTGNAATFSYVSGDVIHDYNLYASTCTQGKQGEANGILTNSFPFVSSSDYHLASSVGGGTNLGTEFATDMDGHTASGQWDIGAYQYASSTNAAPLAPHIYSVNGKLVRFVPTP